MPSVSRSHQDPDLGSVQGQGDVPCQVGDTWETAPGQEMDPEETVPGQEIDPGGNAWVILDPVTIVTTPATLSEHQNMFDRSWKGPVETTPDQ